MINDELLNAIEEKFGRTIRYSKDCDVLANDILKKTGCSVSASTLKRILGFGDSYFIPRLYTLDSVGKYLGFNSWNEVPYMGVKDTDEYQNKVKVTFDSGDFLIISRYDDKYARIIGHSFPQNPHVSLVQSKQLAIGDKLKIFHSDLKSKTPRSLHIRSLEIL